METPSPDTKALRKELKKAIRDVTEYAESYEKGATLGAYEACSKVNKRLRALRDRIKNGCYVPNGWKLVRLEDPLPPWPWKGFKMVPEDQVAGWVWPAHDQPELTWNIVAYRVIT